MRPKLRSPIPRHNGTRNTHDKPDDPTRHRMQHRPVEGQPRRNVAPQDAIDDAIRRCQRKWSITSRLPRRRKDTHPMQQQIGGQSQNKADNHTCEHRADPSSIAPLMQPHRRTGTRKARTPSLLQPQSPGCPSLQFHRMSQHFQPKSQNTHASVEEKIIHATLAIPRHIHAQKLSIPRTTQTPSNQRHPRGASVPPPQLYLNHARNAVQLHQSVTQI